jgi:tRNA A-37 threonylcarbamoyl transferase component Bud32
MSEGGRAGALDEQVRRPAIFFKVAAVMDTTTYQPGLARSSAPGDGRGSPNQAPVADGMVQAAQTALPEDCPTALREHVRYRILTKLGEGGMGAVYLAEHKLMHRQVALKVIRADLSAQPQLIQRFQREVQAAAQLSHPNIVIAYDAEQAGSCHFLVMEYVEGTDLARLVKERGPLSVRQACDCVRQAALGLQHAHEHQLIHRDLKPQNLMRTAEGQIKILDFGLARAVRSAWEDGGDCTASGVVLGTPDYMAPEQADDAGNMDIRADIYSLGCTLYHLLSGRVPFPGRSTMSKLTRHAQEQPTPLNELRPQLPAELVQVVARMMTKTPAARYQTPIEVAAALAPWCQDQPETVALPKAARASLRWFLRRRWLLAVALLLVLAGLVTYFLPVWPRGSGDAEGDNNSVGSPALGPRKRVAPDRRRDQLLIDDDFSGAAKLPFFPPGEKADQFFKELRNTARLQDHRLVLNLDLRRQPPRFTACYPPVECANFVCEVRARAEGKDDAGWAIYHDDGGDSTLWVMIRLDGRVEVNESGRTAATAFAHNLGTFRAPSARPTAGFTTVKVRRQGQVLKVFVNGEAVCDPLRLERKFAAGHQYVAVWGRGTGEVRAEFARYALWRLP